MKCIQPSYLDKFVCDGRACGARCCRDWRIVVDDDTYEKYSALDISDREEILSHTDWIEDEREMAEVLTLKLRDDGVCSFLDEDYLCQLQKQHGEDYLTAICQSFPRVTYKLAEDFFEQSMTLTCPVAAQLILFQTEPITFGETSTVTTRAVIKFKKKLSRPVEEFVATQMDAIKILQDRNLTINRRLRNLCALFRHPLPEVDFNADDHAKVLVNIFDSMYNANLSKSKKLELCGNYLNNRGDILRQTQEKFGNVLENYLVNEFFMRCYPDAFVGSEWLNCKIFVTGFRILEFAIVLTVIAKKRLTLDELAVMIYSVNDMLDHSRGGMDDIVNFADVCDVGDFVSLMIES